MINLGKYKLLFQHTWSILAMPIGIINMLLLIGGFFGWHLVLWTSPLLLFLMVGTMYLSAKHLISQEYNYAWQKCDEWQSFRRDWDKFRSEYHG